MKARWMLFIVSLLGVLNGLWMLTLHLRYEELGSVCSVTETISCEVLTFKEYSEWFGIPVPVFSTLLFFLLSIISYRIVKNRAPVAEVRYGFVLSTVALVTAVGMAYISFFVLKMLCVYCFLYYILIVKSWIGFGWLLKNKSNVRGEVRASEMFRARWFVPSHAFMGIVLVASYFAFQNKGSLSVEAVEIKGDEIKTTGNPGSKTTLTVFSDFQCPACKRMAQVLTEVEKDQGSKIKLVYKFFPLDPACNPGAPYGRHLMACDAARAALCAGQQGKFWRFHDRLFEAQETLHEKKFFEIARTELLNMDEFKACYESSSAAEAVTSDAKEGIELKIDATPTLFINGKKYQGSGTKEDILGMLTQVK